MTYRECVLNVWKLSADDEELTLRKDIIMKTDFKKILFFTTANGHCEPYFLFILYYAATTLTY